MPWRQGSLHSKSRSSFLFQEEPVFFWYLNPHPQVHGSLLQATAYQHFLPYQAPATESRSRSAELQPQIQIFRQQRTLPSQGTTVWSAMAVSFSYSRSSVPLNPPRRSDLQVLHSHLPSHHLLTPRYLLQSEYRLSFHPVSVPGWNPPHNLQSFPHIHWYFHVHTHTDRNCLWFPAKVCFLLQWSDLSDRSHRQTFPLHR